jgi:hypothetical protein
VSNEVKWEEEKVDELGRCRRDCLEGGKSSSIGVVDGAVAPEPTRGRSAVQDEDKVEGEK